MLCLVNIREQQCVKCCIDGLPIFIGSNFAILSNSKCIYFALRENSIVVTDELQLRKGTVMSVCANENFLVLGSTGSTIDIYRVGYGKNFTHLQTLKCPQYPI